MTRRWTIDEFAMHFWGTFPRNQFEINLQWLNSVVAGMKIGGLWAWPEKKMILKKVDKDTLEEVTGE